MSADIRIIKGSLVEDLKIAENVNAIDCLYLEKPANRETYNTGWFYGDLGGVIGKIDQNYDRITDHSARTKDLQHDWFNAKYRKMKMAFIVRSHSIAHSEDGIKRTQPYNLALGASYLMQKPKSVWKRELYKSQIKQLIDFWKYEDEILPEDYTDDDMKCVMVSMLENNHKEEQLEVLNELFDNFNVIIVLYDDKEYDRASALKAPKRVITKYKEWTVEGYIKRGWADTRRAGHTKRYLSSMKPRGLKPRHKLTKEQQEEVKRSWREANPVQHLQNLVKALKMSDTRGLKEESLENIRIKIVDWIQWCYDNGKDISKSKWFGYENQFKDKIEEIYHGNGGQ